MIFSYILSYDIQDGADRDSILSKLIQCLESEPIRAVNIKAIAQSTFTFNSPMQTVSMMCISLKSILRGEPINLTMVQVTALAEKSVCTNEGYKYPIALIDYSQYSQ